MENKQQELTQRTIFRHGIRTSEELMDIIDYLERQLPGATIRASEAIRFAIAGQAIKIRKEMSSSQAN